MNVKNQVEEIEVEDEVLDEEPVEGTVVDIDGLSEYLANGIPGCMIVSFVVISLTIVLMFAFGGIINRLKEMERKIDYCYQSHKEAENKESLTKETKTFEKDKKND